MNRNGQVTDLWQLYEDGKNYNHKITPDLYDTVNKNERFYAGAQWEGVVSNGLPTPVFNIFKRIINFFIASIMSQKVKMQFSVENIPDETQDMQEQELQQVADMISKHSEMKWEKLKMDTLLRDGLLDAALTGDMVAYTYWEHGKDTGQTYGTEKIKGDFCTELIDNVNVMFGNPNDRNPQKQPYILIIGRDLVSNLKKEAKENGVKEHDRELITNDEETLEQAGDRGKIELDNGKGSSGKCLYMIKMWKEENTIWYTKATKFCVIKEKIDMKLKLYPVALMNWDKRKNSYHGQALATGLIPNQIYINKQFAMVMKYMMDTAFGKVVYDKTKIASWSNAVGAAIGMTGDVAGAVQQLNPGQMNNSVMQVIDQAISLTKELTGATDAALGNVDPKNKGAIIAVQQASSIALETTKANLYQFVEDLGLIWLDFMLSKYEVPRKISYRENEKVKVGEFQGTQYQDIPWSIKIDVGPSSYWSEITSVQTLDALLERDKISFIQYLDRLPNGFIPKKQELIDELQQQIQQQQQMQMQQQQALQQQAMMQQQAAEQQAAQEQQIQDQQMQEEQQAQQQKFEQMAQFMDALPEEVRNKIMAMPETEQERIIMQMMRENVRASMGGMR